MLDRILFILCSGLCGLGILHLIPSSSFVRHRNFRALLCGMIGSVLCILLQHIG